MAGAPEDVFPIFRTPPKSPGRCLTPNSNATGSTGKSPLKRRNTFSTKNCLDQNNKIFRYLQPKRLLDEASTSSPIFSFKTKDSLNAVYNDVENSDLILKVILTRIDEEVPEDSQKVLSGTELNGCCMRDRSLESELVVQALDHTIQVYLGNPCHRLGIPQPRCFESTGCDHETKSQVYSPTLETLFRTMMNSNLSTFMLRGCLQRLSGLKYPSADMVHIIFNIMEVSVDQQTLSLCEKVLKRLISVHPPCSLMRNFYVTVLHKSSLKLSTSNDFWSLLSCDRFEKVLGELEKLIETVLSPVQLKEKLKTPTVRKIIKPRRFRDSPSPVKRSQRGRKNEVPMLEPKGLDFEDREMLVQEELSNISEQARNKRLALQVSLKSMSLELKIDHIFSRFNILVDILEYNFVVWLRKHSSPFTAIRDRVTCPLIVLCLWRPADDTGFDSANCRRVFSLYVSLWILNAHPKHLKTTSRLIGLIAEVIAVSDSSCKKTYPQLGDRCESIAHKFSSYLQNDQLIEQKHEAVLMLKPVWFQMLVSATMLGIPPSLSSIEPLTVFHLGQEKVPPLWFAFLLSAISYYHIKEADKLLQQASLVPSSMDISISEAPYQTIDYKMLLNEIVSFYDVKTKFHLNSPAIPEGNSSCRLLKEVFM